jgi:hypothetical protein
MKVLMGAIDRLHCRRRLTHGRQAAQREEQNACAEGTEPTNLILPDAEGANSKLVRTVRTV